MLAHRRAGKTVASVNEIVARAIYCKRHRPRYSYVAPFRNQAKKIAWNYLKDYTEGMTDKVSEADLSVKFAHNQAEVTLYGADNPDAFRGGYNDGALIDEFGDMNPTVLTRNIFPTLADRRGWLVLIGTPKGKNHFFKQYMSALQNQSDWYTLLLKASESGILPPEELKIQRENMDEDEYLQEYECSFDAAVKGAYYAELIAKLEADGRVDALIEFDENFPVKVACDIGFTDSTSLWFWQDRPDGLAIIDYEEHHSQPLGFYMGLLQSKPYRYSEIWFPHDARANSFQTGRSTIEQAMEFQLLGDPRVDITPNLAKQHGIDAARKILPMCWFNPRCMPGLEALRAYKRKWDETTKAYSNNAEHDWSSHGADAFRYLSLVCGRGKIQRIESKIITPFQPKYQLDTLFADRETKRSRIARI
jgi:hypothetical protein